MIEALLAVVFCLAASTAILAASVPFLYWRCFRFDAKLEAERDKLQKQVDTLDETLARLLSTVGVPASSTAGGE